MIKHTQPYNCCVQTSLACILDVPLEQVPPQYQLETLQAETKVMGSFGAYQNILQGYLYKHHKLRLAELWAYEFAGIATLKYPYHLACGPTIRTALDDRGLHHAVVAYNGEVVWDPHESRAGLLEITSWKVLSDADPKFAPDPYWKRNDGQWENKAKELMANCLCPSCNLYELIELARTTAEPVEE